MKKLTARVEVGLLIGTLLMVLELSATGATRSWTAASAGYWTNAANWSGGVVPGPADDVVFDASGNGSCTIDCAVVVSSLNITSGYASTIYLGVTNVAGDLTVSNDFYLVSGATIVPRYSSTNGEGTGRVITVGGNATIAGTVNADAQGFPAVSGPGSSARGGTHGGWGFGEAVGTIYGSLTAPTALGSSGKSSDNRVGGGAIKLSVVGALAVAGTISANGGGYMDGDAGGSVWLIANTLTGAGRIQADGGSVPYYGGGGGRVALEYNSSTFSGSVSVAGGKGPNSGDGQPGTLWEPKRFCNMMGSPGNLSSITVTTSYQYVFSDPLSNCWWNLTIGSGLWVEFHRGLFNLGDLTVTNGSILRFDNYSITNEIGSLTITNRLNLAASSRLYLPSSSITNTYTFSELRIATNAGLYVGRGDTNAVNAASGGTTSSPHGVGTIINCQNAVIEGTLTASSKGFHYVSGPGSGARGGSHGGCGYGDGVGKTYGSLTAPTALGSSGKSSNNRDGGGAIKLSVAGALDLNGTISADGGGYLDGDAGGSAWVIADTLTGTGRVQAVGCTAAYYGGGGGRVALEYNISTFSGLVSVAGGGATYNSPGKTGTWFVCQTPFLGACSTGCQGVALASAFSVSSNDVKIARTIAQWKGSQPKLQWTDLSTDLAGNQLNNIETNTLSGLPANTRVTVFTNDALAYTLNTGTNGTISFAVPLDSEQTIRVEGPSGGTRFVFH